MSDKERLIELLDNATVEKVQYYPNGTPAMMYCEKAVNTNTAIQLADYLLSNGVIVLPCKAGDTVYVITTKLPCYACYYCTAFCHKSCRYNDRAEQAVKKAKVCSIELGENNKIHTEIEKTKKARAYNYTYWFTDLGETVFLTREEAEAKLKEIK